MSGDQTKKRRTEMSKNPRDIFHRLKFIGYCWSQLPPEEADVDLEDFVRYCKFQLCKSTNTLMKDPIWDDYIDEEIIAEYYAHLFVTSKEERQKLLSALQGHNEEIFDWLDKMIADNQKDVKEKAEELDDGFDFSPDQLGD